MAFHKREASRDITSNAHATPLPTYYSQQLPRWTSKSAFEDQKAFEIKTEPLGPSYPQFAAPLPRFDDIPLPPRPQRRRFPRKSIMVPWILATIFFLTTLWFTSIALGVRLFVALQPAPANPPVQEIRVLINEDVFGNTASTYTSFVTLSVSAARATSTVNAPTSTDNETIVPTSSEKLDTAPIRHGDTLEVVDDLTTIAPVPRNIKTSPTGFVTVTRTV
ncbi:hypothetical protein OPT61_g3240 [Boeremia exigua]|uniref:Uncharacterized protein n=1 Tax=Boeremia exigua TaxID=749465 RepID=A0ACC2IIK8_9PLEO|nr:hypothetical protein OPT61_g3240 [Boeremia exigua]